MSVALFTLWSASLLESGQYTSLSSGLLFVFIFYVFALTKCLVSELKVSVSVRGKTRRVPLPAAAWLCTVH